MLFSASFVVCCLVLQAHAAPGGGIKGWFKGSSSRTREVTPPASPEHSVDYSRFVSETPRQSAEYEVQGTPQRSWYQEAETRTPARFSPARSSPARSENEIQEEAPEAQPSYLSYYSSHQDYPTDSRLGTEPMTRKWDHALQSSPIYLQNVQQAVEEAASKKGGFKKLKPKKEKKGWFG